jgi:hypothetical protein
MRPLETLSTSFSAACKALRFLRWLVRGLKVTAPSVKAKRPKCDPNARKRFIRGYAGCGKSQHFGPISGKHPSGAKARRFLSSICGTTKVVP